VKAFLMLRTTVIFAAVIGASVVASAQERQDFLTRCETVPADSCQWGNLQKRNLDGKDLSDSNYKAVHMQGATLRDATLERLNLQTADVSDADFSRANLAQATFFAANAERANFSGARLEGVNFTRANLAGANLQGARIDASTWFVGTRLGGAVWIDGRKCAANSVGRCD
jgi:uncharacterized protein YjbI with pentapeptide repeats